MGRESYQKRERPECSCIRGVPVFGCLMKTPGCAGEFKKSFSVPYEEKTPFDTIRVRSANCTKVSKGGQKA